VGFGGQWYAISKVGILVAGHEKMERRWQIPDCCCWKDQSGKGTCSSFVDVRPCMIPSRRSLHASS